ncbi:MAG: 4-hydroxythreonine-4-phosphate dehydrogenase PdxA [Phycisphaerae bacterium]|nr:4-hydroxythreonine-4-phosphate dehydrogenase PdxA [Phycisphaerae bacterium]
MGDPLGIGPEIIAKAAGDRHARDSAGWMVFGSAAALDRAAGAAGCPRSWRIGGPPPHAGEMVVIDDGEWSDTQRAGTPPGPDEVAGRASLTWVEHAVEAAKRPADHPLNADAIVTAPIAKESWALAGSSFPGHTELLSARLDSPRCAMLFVGPTLRVILVTIHVPLARVPALLTTARVRDAIELGHEACVTLGLRSPRIAVAGLNPHAGENGMFGREDADIIAPAVTAARAAGIDASGPHPGDAVFLAAAKGRYDLVVAMYHDQGLIPVKLVDRESAVNVTVGLRWQGRPVIRTSPAHGTAFDIAGRNQADASSMIAAIRTAAEMAIRPRN